MPNIHYWRVSHDYWIAVLIRADLPCLVPLVLFHNKIHTRSETIKHLVWEHGHTGNPSESGKQRCKNRWARVWVLLNWSIQGSFQKLIAGFPSVTLFTVISMVIAKKKKSKFISSGENQTITVCLVLDLHAKPDPVQHQTALGSALHDSGEWKCMSFTDVWK